MENYYEELKKMTVEELDAESKRLQEEHSKIMSEYEASKSENTEKRLEILNKFDEVDRKMILLVKVLFKK